MDCLNPRPWKLPVPFVATMFRAFFGLIMLANANAVYERLEILTFSADYALTTNVTFVSQFVIGVRFLPRLRG